MEKLCEYGCGCIAKYTTKQGKNICSEYATQCPVNRDKNSKMLKLSYQEGTRVSVTTFNDKARKKAKERRNNNLKLAFEEGKILSNHAIKRLLSEHYNRGNCCECCGITLWQDQPISFELDHIDGDASNNSLNNLQILCPNCHSQTLTFRGRNKNSGTKKVSDEILTVALKEYSNIRQALIAVGLSPRGGNYSRVAKLLLK